MLTTDPTVPSYQRPERQAVQADLDLMSDLIAGTRRMHEKAATYVRKWAKEKDDIYTIRSKIENCFEGTGRTLSAAVGMLFAQPPSTEWNQSETVMSPHVDNIDLAGAALHVYLKRFAEKAIRDGLVLNLVDHTPAPKGVEIHSENEGPLGLRPKWAMYDRSQIISWREGLVNNRKTLTHVVLYECGTIDDGEFGVRIVHRYRKLALLLTGTGYVATWKLFEYVGDDPSGAGRAENYRVVSGGVFKNRKGQHATFLPISIAYAGRSDGLMQAAMPLLGVAFANLAHYQQSTNLRFYRELCAFPQRKIKGDLKGETDQNGGLTRPAVPSGPGVILHLEAEADASWDELEGTSMAQLESGIAEKLAQMGAMGLAFLAPQKRQAETEEAKRLDAVAQNATLATAGQAIEDAANLSLEHHAWFMGIEKKAAPRLTISKEFENPTLTPDEMRAWAEAFDKMGLPIELVLQHWQDRLAIPKDVDIDVLADRMRFNIEQRRLQKEQEARDRLAAAAGAIGGGDDDDDDIPEAA